jgi:hypothetical protein
MEQADATEEVQANFKAFKGAATHAAEDDPRTLAACELRCRRRLAFVRHDNRWLDVSGNESCRQERECGLLALQAFDHVFDAGEAFLFVVVFDHDGGSLRR